MHELKSILGVFQHPVRTTKSSILLTDDLAVLMVFFSSKFILFLNATFKVRITREILGIYVIPQCKGKPSEVP
jgi:hypothetical protein